LIFFLNEWISDDLEVVVQPDYSTSLPHFLSLYDPIRRFFLPALNWQDLSSLEQTSKECRDIIRETTAYWKYYLDRLLVIDTDAKRLHDKHYSIESLTIEPRILHGKLIKDLHEIQRNIEGGKFTISSTEVGLKIDSDVPPLQVCALHEDGDHVFVVGRDQTGVCTLKQFSLIAGRCHD
jgi:hypothetical protein